MRMLALDSMESVTARDVTRSKRLKKAESLLKSFLGNSLHLLGEMYVLTEGIFLLFSCTSHKFFLLVTLSCLRTYSILMHYKLHIYGIAKWQLHASHP